MNTMLVWLLIVVPNSSQNSPFQHGPFADLESCQRVQAVYLAVPEEFRGERRKTRCVQVLVPVDSTTPVTKKGA